MRYTTRDGITLEVGRVDRRRLDALNVPAPTPPVRAVETWGGVVEHVPVEDDPVYQRELYRWQVHTFRAQLRVLATALTVDFTAAQQAQLAALAALEIADGDPVADYMRFMLSPHDQRMIIAEIFYQSTVSVRGISEALQLHNYTWRDRPVFDWPVNYTPGKRCDLGLQMHSALRSNLTWAQFCALSGPEQSELVAFWILEDRLAWLGAANAN